MAYINDHKILSGEEMMVGNVAAKIGLGTGFPGAFNQRATGTTAHGHTAHRDFRNMRAAGHLESEPGLDIFNEPNAITATNKCFIM